MANYLQLHNLATVDAATNDLKKKVEFAIVVAAEKIQNETGEPNQAERWAWAANAFDNPKAKVCSMLYALLAADRGQSVDTIQGASDAAIQARVDAAVNVFAGGIIP